MQLILGIDPALKSTGFGIIQYHKHQFMYVGSGTIVTKTEHTLPERLGCILEALLQVIAQYQPHCMCIEQTFMNSNAKTSLLLGHARGTMMAAANLNKLPIYEYSALQIKKAVTGQGWAEKQQMQLMVKEHLKLPALPRTDVADALACAMTHAQYNNYRLIK